MKLSNIFGIAFLSVVLSVSARAACGGGGYQPSRNSSTTTHSTSYTSQSNYNQSSTVSNRPSSNFDVSAFHNVSGQLHLSGEQATSVIGAIQDIRKKLDDSSTPKDFDPKKEFEHRLATILNADQIKTYQSSASMAKKS
jgi:hypothetical protein